MQLLADNQLPPASSVETVFRFSPWWSLTGFLLFAVFTVVAPLALLIATFFSNEIHGFHWLRVLLLLFMLFMTPFCVIYSRTCAAAFRPANWLTRIGPAGLLVKYRSYLHDDSPPEDPIAIQLSWEEILDVHLQKEVLYTSVATDRSQVQRSFLVIRLNPRVDAGAIRSAIEFERQRKPAHFRVDDLKHELFLARKNKADASEIARITQALQTEQKRYPGRHSKGRFQHSPVTFTEPDKISIEWTSVTPGKRTLGKLLSRYTELITDEKRHLHADKPMSEDDFNGMLTTFLNRNDEMEAVKLVRQHKGCSLAEAKEFIEGRRQNHRVRS